MAMVETSLSAISSFVLLATLVGLVVYPWYRSFREGRFDPFEPIIFYSVFIGMTAIALANRSYLSEPGFAHDVISYSYSTGLLIVGTATTVSFAATLIGYYRLGPRVSSPIGGRSSLKIALNAIERAPTRAYQAVALGYMVTGLASFLAIVVFIFPTNELLYMFSTFQPRSQVFAGNNVLVMGTRLLYLGYFLWLTGALIDQRTPSLLELAAFTPVAGIILLLGGRGRVMMITIVFVVLLYYVFVQDVVIVHYGHLSGLVGRISPVVALLALPVLALGLAIPLLMLRGLRLGWSIRRSLTDVNPISIATAGIQNDKFDNFLALIEVVPSEIGYYYGTFYARAILNFIPRALWPEKPPLYAGAVLRRAIMPDGTGGRPPGSIGTYYMNFGWLGIPLLAALYGVLLHLLYRLIRERKTSPFRLLVFAFILANFGRSGITNGALHQILTHAILLLPAAAILYVVSKLERTDRRPHSLGH